MEERTKPIECWKLASWLWILSDADSNIEEIGYKIHGRITDGIRISEHSKLDDANPSKYDAEMAYLLKIVKRAQRQVIAVKEDIELRSGG